MGCKFAFVFLLLEEVLWTSLRGWPVDLQVIFYKYIR